MGESRPLNAKLFLEGLEVPLIGATITSQVNTASIAYIDIIPHETINNIKPRTHVMIAVRDYKNKLGGFPYVKAWEGEVFGFTFNKTAMSRSMTLSCIDYTSYWDNVLTYYINPTTELAKGGNILYMGLDVTTAKLMQIESKAIPESQGTFFKNLMVKALDKGDLLDGLVNAIKSITKINKFYSDSAERLKINERIMIHSSRAISKLFAQREAIDWFMGIADSAAGGFTSLRQTVTKLMSVIFHDQVTIPFPSISGKTQKEFVFKPNTFMISPPCCNVFFPDEYASFTYSRNFLVEPTRLVYRPVLPTLGNGQEVAMPHVYAPENLNKFMFSGKKKQEYDQNSSIDDGVSEDPGAFGENNTEEGKDISPLKKEQFFMTNEEKLKGIMLAIENMVPASTEFCNSLSNMTKQSFSKLVANYMLVKKKFQTREMQITSHLKLSVVPGFPALVLDDSPAGQNTVAYVSSVTHRIYATEGGYTNVVMSYARSVQEQQASSSIEGTPLIPQWFDETIFGSIKEEKNEKGEVTAKRYISGNKLSDFYSTLLGSKGSKAVSDLAKDKSLVSSTNYLLSEYRKHKEAQEDILDFISKYTDRSYIPIETAFSFIGATTNSRFFAANNDEKGQPLISFDGGALITGVRKTVCVAYQNAIKEGRAFRG